MKWRGVEAGTPSSGKSLCDTCSYSFIVKGEADSEKKVFCEAVFNKPIQITFRKVVECSRYDNKKNLNLHQMQKTAYILMTDPRGRPIGFKSNTEFRKQEGNTNGDIVEEP